MAASIIKSALKELFTFALVVSPVLGLRKGSLVRATNGWTTLNSCLVGRKGLLKTSQLSLFEE